MDHRRDRLVEDGSPSDDGDERGRGRSRLTELGATLGASLDLRVDGVRDRWDRPATRLVAALGAMAVVVGAVLLLWPESGGEVQAAPTIGVSSVPTTAPSASIVVHIAGAVRQPGLYRIAKGARVADLLELAGGPGDDLDLDRTNLAEPLTDGARIWLPRRGQPSPAVSGGVESSGSHPAAVDINTATAAQLDTVTGIGPSLAAAIVKERDAHGPFRTVDDLRRVKGIGASKLESIRPSLVAG